MTKEYMDFLADLENDDKGGLDDAYADSLELELEEYGDTIELEDLDEVDWLDFDPITGEVGK